MQFWTVIIAMIMAVSACATTTSEAPAVDPTQPLIVFTPSDTPIPLTPTPSPSPGPAAGQLLLTPQSTSDLTTSEAEIIAATENDLVSQLELDDAGDVQRVLYEAVHWQGDELECESDPLRLTTQGIAGFRVVYLVDDTVYIYRTGDAEFMLCEELPSLEAPPDVIVQIDPVAADVVSLAQRRIANELDISTRRVNVERVEVRLWEDSSLGCPAEGQTYTPVETNGYRIVLTAADTEYIFHANFDRLVLCQDEPVEVGESEEN